MKVVDAFNSAQRSVATHPKAIAALVQTYRACSDQTDFVDEFLNCFNHALLVFKREPAAERIVEFACKFAAATHEVRPE